MKAISTEGNLERGGVQMEGCEERHSDGGFGEGHSEVMVLSQIMVVELNEALDCLFDRAHLDQGHLAIFPVKLKTKEHSHCVA